MQASGSPPEMLWITIPVAEKLMKKLICSTPCLVHLLTVLVGPWWHCVAPWAAGQVISQHWQNGNWQSAADTCVRFAASSTFYPSGGTPDSTARSQGWMEWKESGKNTHNVTVLHRSQLMWCRLGCNFNHSPCCLQIHVCHPSPIYHHFCILEDLSWALTLVLTSSLIFSLHFCWHLVVMKIHVIPRSVWHLCQTWKAPGASAHVAERRKVLIPQWKSLFSALLVLFYGITRIFLHICRRACVFMCPFGV